MIWQMLISPNSKADYCAMTEQHVLLPRVCADFKCASVSGEEMRHWELLKFTKHDYFTRKCLIRRGVEPYYAEKVTILKEIGRWKNVALEVMPKEAELVDNENLYHMWEFEHLQSFQFDPMPIFTPPNSLDRRFKGIHYTVATRNGIEYLYFTSDDKMPWREKQALKNHAVGTNRIGVEIITERMLGVGYGAIIILPPNRGLCFTLE